MPSQDTLASALGAYGPGTIIRADGKEWSFVFDIPATVAGMEELCRLWHREKYEKELAKLPDRNTPGSFDNQCAMQLWNEFRTEDDGDECRPPHPGPDGKPVVGKVYAKWAKTREGQLGYMLAALRIKHPDATYQTLMSIAEAAPDQFQAVVVQLGNGMRDAAFRVAAHLRKTSPAMTEAAATVEKTAGELGAVLSGLQGSGFTAESRLKNSA